MSRADSVRLAYDKARQAGSSLLGAALASDAFFPFADGPQLALDAGVTASSSRAASVRDPDVVAAADAAGISMVQRTAGTSSTDRPRTAPASRSLSAS